MNLMDLPISFRHYFDQSPDVLGGKLRLRGTRVSLEQILELLEAGVPPAEIAQKLFVKLSGVKPL